MERYPKDSSRNAQKDGPQKLVIILLVCVCGLAVLLSFLPKVDHPADSTQSPTNSPRQSQIASRKHRPGLVYDSKSDPVEKQTAEEQVAARLTAFNKNRRETARRYADKLRIAVPTDLEKFFDAADRGNWEEIDRLYKELQKKRIDPNYPDAEALQKLFPTAQETWGAHGSAHSWPAQDLLDYGRDVLGSLKPDMVYLGGTDPGRFIPTFLNETSGGEPHIVLTQNALADGIYLDYVNFLYGDRMQTVGAEDSQMAFKQYLEDAAKRFAHDQQFPDEPKQMRPGENYKNEEGRVQVSGQPAVMSINELLLQKLQEKNPGLSFGMEESFSLPSTYKGAVPLGPLMELGAENATAPLTSSMADSSLNYWRDRVSQLTSAPEFDASQESGRAYAHMITAQGNLFSSQNFSTEAEQAYRLAQQLTGKYDLEPTGKLYDLLMRNGRAADATTVLTQFQQTYPDKADAIQKLVNQKR
ncbi:MAG: hypothetical protein JWQ71_1260 [Pedosphaera sp.]|nr:hypothetical protein [Pedosphaera sp.]